MILWDERLTTVASEKVLMESGVRRENRKKVIDSDRGVYDFTGIFRFPIGGTDNEQERAARFFFWMTMDRKSNLMS